MRTFEDILRELPADFCTRRRRGWFRHKLAYDFGIHASRPGRRRIGELHPKVQSVGFLLASYGPELVEAFARSELAQHVEQLEIGGCCDCDRWPFRWSFDAHLGVDYRAHVAHLAGADLPSLTSLSLGSWRLLINQGKLHGRMGDITPVLTRHRHVESLFLGGYFALGHPVAFTKLRSLTVEVQDVTGGIEPLLPGTVRNLLASDLSNVERLTLDLHSYRLDRLYELPPEFLAGATTPRLKMLRLSGPSGWSVFQALRESVWFASRVRMRLDERR